MDITLPVIHYFLQKNHHFISNPEICKNIKLSQTRLLDENVLEPDTLYITDDIQHLPTEKKAKDCAFIIIGQENTYQSDSSFNTKAIFIHEEIPPLSILYEVIEIFLLLQHWDTQLKDILLENKGYPLLFSVTEKIIDFPFAFIDKHYNVMQASSRFFLERPTYDQNLVPAEYINNLLMDGGEYYKASSFKNTYIYPSTPSKDQAICCNIFCDNHFEGRITALALGNPIHKGLHPLLAHFTKYVEKVYFATVENAYEQRQNDALHTMVRGLLTGTANIGISLILQTLSTYNWELKHQFTTVIFFLPDKRKLEHSASYICRYLENSCIHSCAIPFDNQIVFLVNHSLNHDEDKDFMLHKITKILAKDFACKVGVSMCNNFSNLLIMYKQAETALRLGQINATHDWYYPFSNHIFEYIMEHTTSEYTAEQLIHPGLTILKCYDLEHGTEYIKTIQSYFSSLFNASEAARQLFIHRTTFFRRLDKIKELTDIDFNDYNNVLHIAISLLLLK